MIRSLRLLQVPYSSQCRTISNRFLPFDDAKEYARKLGLTKYEEWAAWAKSGARPPFIPSNPVYSYRGRGWTSYADFLGYHRSLASWRRQEFLEEIAENNRRTLQGTTPYAASRRAFAIFNDFLDSSTGPTLELRELSWRSSLQYVFRPRASEASEAEWFPLLIRFRRSGLVGRRMPIGRINDEAAVTGMVIIDADPSHETMQFYFLPKEFVEELVMKYGIGKSMYASISTLLEYRVGSGAELIAKLLQHYENHADLRMSDNDDDHQMFLRRGGKFGARFSHLRQQFSDRFYVHLGWQLGAPAERSCLWDTNVESKRIIHRTVIWTWMSKNKRAFASVGLQHYIGRHVVPLRMNDDFDFIIALHYDYDDPSFTLRGAFFFPKSALRRNLSGDDGPGNLHVPVYTPDMPAQNRKSRQRKELCLRYYIDLSNPDSIEEQIDKARAIFSGEGESLEPISPLASANGTGGAVFQ